MEDRGMATATKTKAAPAAPVLPSTFAEINARRVRERIESYRGIAQRHASGQAVTIEDMERAGELLEQLGLPQYTFERDVEAVQRDKVSRDKWQAAADAAPGAAKRAAELAAEIEETKKKLDTLREEHRRAAAAISKPAGYEHTLRQLAADHPHVLANLDTAVRLRIQELDRRKQMGGAA
jgi:hypothetical protein